MKKLLILTLTFAVVCLSLFGLVACNGASDDVIRLNEVTHSVFYAPLYVAINEGYFDEYGIKIELTNGGGADKSMTAVLSNQADVALLGPESAVYINLQGSDNYPVVFGQLTQRDGAFLIGRKPVNIFRWSDLAGSEIIGGRKGGMPAMSLEHALLKNGLKKGVDLTLNYDVQFDLITAAFEGGTGDYCTMFEPAASQYEQAGKGYILAGVGEEAGDIPYTCFAATKKYLDGHREKLTDFMRAINKGIRFVLDSDPEKVADALQVSFPTTDRNLLIKSVQSYKKIDAYAADPMMKEESFDRMLTILMEAGSIDKKVEFSDIIDNSIAKKVLSEG